MTDNERKGFCKFGGICAIIAGCLYLITVCLVFALPATVSAYEATDTFFQVFPRFKTLFVSMKCCISLANMAMIGVILTFMMLCRQKNKAFVTWVSILGIIGYALGLAKDMQDMTLIPRLVEQYHLNGDSIKVMIKAIGLSNPKLFLLSLGLPGIWFIVVSILGATNKYIPKLLILLGICCGVGNILTAIAFSFGLMPILYMVALGALICAPAWGILEGLYLFNLTSRLEEST